MSNFPSILALDMDPLSALPAVGSLFVALLTAGVITRAFGAPADQGRFASIDGLRGYLAFFVFLHHSGIWYFYLRSGQWYLPSDHLYIHFGQSGVAMFFMITAFLFFSKLMDAKSKGIDFGRLFVSRVMRLTPLYVFAMALLFSVVAWVSHGELSGSFLKLVRDAVRWMSFTILGAPDLNGVERTFVILAGVTWTLPYEWFFYLLLPLLAFMLGMRPPARYMRLGVAGLVAFLLWRPKTQYLYPFLGGILAAFLVRVDAFRELAQEHIASLLVLASIGVTVATFPTAYRLAPSLLLSFAFALVAGGNTLFGALTHPISRALGQVAYSIYLLHGIVLFIAFRFVVGMNESRGWSAEAHWSLIVAITPLLIFGSYLTFRFIERPAMERTDAVTRWLRSRSRRKASAASGVSPI